MKRLTAGLLLAASMLLSGPAAAQFSPGGGPIDISADELELVDSEHMAIWRGAVEALQGRNRMRADVVNIYFTGQPTNGAAAASGGAPGRNWGKVQRIVADGKVFYISPTQTARGDHADYELSSDNITITGDVIVSQGQSVVHGDKLLIDTKTGQATMVATGSGRSGRVRGVFYPNSTNTPPGAPSPPPARQK